MNTFMPKHFAKLTEEVEKAIQHHAYGRETKQFRENNTRKPEDAWMRRIAGQMLLVSIRDYHVGKSTAKRYGVTGNTISPKISKRARRQILDGKLADEWFKDDGEGLWTLRHVCDLLDLGRYMVRAAAPLPSVYEEVKRGTGND